MRSASRAGSKPMGAKKVRASLLGKMLPLIQLPDQLIRIILSFTGSFFPTMSRFSKI